jgi:hypothetical protein
MTFAYTVCLIPARHHTLRTIYVNLLYINMLFLATAIYDCVNMYTIVLLFNTILTIHHGIGHGLTATNRGHLTVKQYYNAIRLSAGLSVVYYSSYSILQTGSADSRIAGW